ncbi:N-acetylmuramoyl-L-alanine amidase [Stappia indica]|uniref:N-acetylmuramoyl-L-alanine amidase n=1 Tax=Stappia indica TaxID=538381 RepID=UPI001CD69E1D|nr:N-acetylmuramoyl-L-alanine amidase [Stappia indica]MCA1298633.1 N-acetylmuramoyl-L-alanine amidase [Stappia indica]
MTIFTRTLCGVALIAAVFAGTVGLRAEEPPRPAVPVAREARVAGDDTRTRFVMDLTQAVPFTVSVLADPHRLVIDFPEVRFDLPEGAGTEARGLVGAWRFGLFAKGKSRIVLDLRAPVAVDKVFVLPSVSDQPARFVLDLVKTSRSAFLAKAGEATAAAPVASATTPSNKGDRLAGGKVKHRPVIVIDPGHGGIDTGAAGTGGTLEKAVVLEFSRLLKKKLDALDRYDVHMTRDTDIFIPLRERVEIARALEADLLVSIHADSVRIGRDQVRGAGVYTLSETASDEIAAALAERENRSDIIAGIDLADEPDVVTDILIDLARQETKTFSHLFARTLVGELSGAAKMVKNPHRSAGFRVLTAHDVPSTLVELGYLSNRLDEKLMTTSEWRERMSSAISGAIDRYFAKRRGKSAALRLSVTPGAKAD